jgi:Ca2+-binding RTX toxin-like protein
MKGTDGFNHMLGRENEDTLKGFGRTDALLGQEEDDTILGGRGHDFVIGGKGDDKLRGEEAVDSYIFERINWGEDTIIEASLSSNDLILPFVDSFTGTITTNLISDSGPVPEVTNSSNTSTINWDSNVITFVLGSSGNDTVTGNDDANDIIDDAGPNFETAADTDAISAGGGNDFIIVQDGDSNDTVICGEGSDTVYFDEGEVLLIAADCEEQNPEEPELEGREVSVYRADALEGAPPVVFGGHRP